MSNVLDFAPVQRRRRTLQCRSELVQDQGVVTGAYVKETSSSAKASPSGSTPSSSSSTPSCLTRVLGLVNSMIEPVRRRMNTNASGSQLTTISSASGVQRKRKRQIDVEDMRPGETHHKKKKLLQAAGKDVELDLVGLASESVEDHRLKHTPYNDDCARCRRIRQGEDLEGKGSIVLMINGRRTKVQWFMDRPTHLGAAWACGCSICSFFLKKLSLDESVESMRAKRRLCTKWGRFEIRTLTSMQPSSLQQHSESKCHRLALASFQDPTAPITSLLQDSAEDDGLLSGAVPQPQDWLRLNRQLKNPVSFNASVKLLGTENFIAGPGESHATKWGVKHMTLVAANVVRKTKKHWIKQCRSMCVSWDDRKD